MLSIDDKTKSKMRSNDRIFVLRPIEGENTLSSKGLVDNRLFTGENALHAIMDTQTCLWSLKYDHGKMEAAFKQQFTGFNKAYQFVETYFKRRNIEIVDVIDG